MIFFFKIIIIIIFFHGRLFSVAFFSIYLTDNLRKMVLFYLFILEIVDGPPLLMIYWMNIQSTVLFVFFYWWVGLL